LDIKKKNVVNIIYEQKRYKDLCSNSIVFMIDITNQRRFEELKREFWDVLNNAELEGIPLLIIGNKIRLKQILTLIMYFPL